MGIDTIGSHDTDLILDEWDRIGVRELLEKDHYLYVLSVVLSEAFSRQTGQQPYDYTLVYDLLSGEKSQSYNKEIFEEFLTDLADFSRSRAEKNIDDTDLLVVFEDSLDRFFVQDHFDRLKSHRLKKRIHKPLLAVLGSRAKQWKKDAPSATGEDIRAVLY